MSGSDESDDELVSGSVNRANDRTIIWAENKYNSVLIGPNPPRTGSSVWSMFHTDLCARLAFVGVCLAGWPDHPRRAVDKKWEPSRPRRTHLP